MLKRGVPKVVDPEARRREVAEAVFRVVRRHGLEQASLRNVADEAGLAIGSVRHYFADHDDLLRFALEELTDRLERRVLARAAQARSAPTREGRRQAVADLLGELLPLDPDRRDERGLRPLDLCRAARHQHDDTRGHDQVEALLGPVTRATG